VARQIVAGLLVGLFGLWAVASVLSQVRRPRVRRLRRFDVLGLVPVWNLFAPRPIVSDYFVSYRIWDAAGRQLHPWRRLPLPGDRRWFDAILNVRRRARKAQWGSANFLMSMKPPQVTTPSYLLLLGAVTRQARRDNEARTVQFRVECIAGHHIDRQRILGTYESERHRV
jgi:hypothetical protein